MRTCDETLELISTALDGTLTTDEQNALNDHLAHCPACSALYIELTGLHIAASELDDIPAPGGFADRVMAQITADPAQDQVDKVVTFPAKKASRTAWKKWTVSAAVVAIVALGAVALPGQFGSMSKTAADEAVAYDTQAQAPASAETADAVFDGFYDYAAQSKPEAAVDESTSVENQSTSRVTDSAETESALEPLATPADGNTSLDISNDAFDAVYCGTLTLTGDVLPDGLEEYESKQDENGNLVYVVPAEYFHFLTDAFDFKIDSFQTEEPDAEYGLIIVKQAS